LFAIRKVPFTVLAEVIENVAAAEVALEPDEAAANDGGRRVVCE
jgi:hypothetical protein